MSLQVTSCQQPVSGKGQTMFLFQLFHSCPRDTTLLQHWIKDEMFHSNLEPKHWTSHCLFQVLGSKSPWLPSTCFRPRWTTWGASLPRKPLYSNRTVPMALKMGALPSGSALRGWIGASWRQLMWSKSLARWTSTLCRKTLWTSLSATLSLSWWVFPFVVKWL